MIVIPAIDLLKGKCVRLTQGKRDACTIYSDDPLAVVKKFKEQGATLVHVVDLDGAFTGKMINLPIICDIAKVIEIQVGGGVRTKEDIDTLRNAGISRIVVGSNLQNLKKYNIIGGLDFKDGALAIKGWTEIAAVDLSAILFGLKEAIVTDVSCDGMLNGPNLDLIKKIKSYGVDVIASGGIRDIFDILKLRNVGAKGVIIGKAVYEGKINLEEAIKYAY